MNQIVIGAALPYLVAILLYVRRRARASIQLLVGAPLTMAICGIWAIIPDIPRALGMESLYHQLANDPRCNIFFMHTAIDQIETDSILYTVAFVVMALSLFGAAWREVRLSERAKAGRP